MTFDPRLDDIHEDRNLILDFLNSAYPNGMLEERLVGVMNDLDEKPSEPEITVRDLGYLEARRLVEKNESRHPVTGRRQTRWRLTAKGLAFVERGRPWESVESDHDDP